MIIQFLLIGGLCVCAVYAYLQRQRSRPISFALMLVAAAGIYFVVFPEQSAAVAHFVGVGRGADLLLYCWQVIVLLILINLQFRILTLQRSITALARELTLQRAGKDAAGGLIPD